MTNLRVRWAEVDFSDADFSRPMIVSPLPFAAFESEWFPELPEWALPDDPDDRPLRPRVVSLCRANVAELVLTDVDLSACRFAGAHNLDQLRLEGDTTFVQPPQGWRRTRFGRWRWTQRDTLAEEQQWRAGKDYSKRDGWHSDETGAVSLDDELLEPRRIASLYRDLRKAREDAKDEPGAADFYYGEMEMRRLDPTRSCSERAILFLYWLTSGYGLRAWRALASLGALWLIFSALFVWVGFAAADSWRTALTYTARTAISLLRDPQPRLLLIGDVLQIGWRLVAPVLLGLIVLSIRGRVKR